MGNFVVIMAEKSCRYNDLEKILLDQNAKPCNLPLQWLQDITSDFSPQRELGRGAFGVVYKGVLRNGQVIAVKKLKELVPGIHDRHFENEVFNLMRLKHKNIVRLIGYCYDIQKIFFEHEGRFILADNQQRLLCLEFLPGGTLEKHLAGESPGLDWHKRYKIIMGICCGLHYLHEQWDTRTPIVHLDLKPANILLDFDMVPKITDFGISRLFGTHQTRIITETLVGTRGYMAPEYLSKGIISTKSDIFSLGVIIIEIIVGHRDYPEITETSTIQCFIEHVIQNWRIRLEGLRCTSLEKDCKQIKICMEVGLKCVDPDATKRPTTTEIIERLKGNDGTNLQFCNEKKSVAKQTSEATLKRKCSEVDLQCTEMRLAKRPATTLEFTDRLNEGMRYRVGRTVDHSTGMEEPRRGQSQVSSGLPQAPLDSTRGPSLVCGADPKGLRDLGRLFVLFSGLLQMRFITQRHDEQEALGLLFWHLGAMLLILSLAAEQYPKQAAAGVAVVRALRNHLFRVF